MLCCKFQLCLSQFTMLLVDGSSETRLFRHWSNNVFRVRNFGNTKSMTVIFLWKCSKFKLEFKIKEKTWEKVFPFSDNCISTGIVKLSLLRTGKLSLASNVVTSSLKIWHDNKKTFSNSIALAVINKYDKGALVQISTVFGPVYHLTCPRVLWDETF